VHRKPPLRINRVDLAGDLEVNECKIRCRCGTAVRTIASKEGGSEREMGTAIQNQQARLLQPDTTFEMHYSIADLAKQWRLGGETARLLVKDEPGVLKIQLGRRKALTRYGVPELSLAACIHIAVPRRARGAELA
jgi:hypothetical protein